jgi:Putative MetA-pathway of phenol degradation
MHFRLNPCGPLWAALSGAAWLALAVMPASGQVTPTSFGRPGCSTPCPWPPAQVQPCPQAQPLEVGPLESRPSEAQPPEARPPDTGAGAGAQAPTGADTGANFPETRGAAVQGATVSMLGNQLNIPALAFTHNNSRITGAALVPSVRGFRISEDESPAPQDRVYFGFNYFDRVNESVNRRLGALVHDIKVYRETFGAEKTCLDGNASVELRLPLNTLTANGDIPGLGGSNTDIGDLTINLKYAFWQDRDTGKLLAGGLAVTAPTGPDRFAGSAVTSFHDTILQPYVGYICNLGNFFVHGFSALDIPTDSNDATFLFTDIGVGIHLNHSRDSQRCITDIIPTFEVHMTNPLNHRGSFNLADPVGSSDQLDLTMGVTLELYGHSTLALGLCTPVTGPRPYDVEALVQFNWYFGARAAGGRGIASPVLGN